MAMCDALQQKSTFLSVAQISSLEEVSANLPCRMGGLSKNRRGFQIYPLAEYQGWIGQGESPDPGLTYIWAVFLSLSSVFLFVDWPSHKAGD